MRKRKGGENKVANFSIATTERWKDKSGKKKEETTWHNIVAWRVLADFAEAHIIAGMGLYIEGKITNRSWEDKEGNKRYTTEIVAEKIDVTNWNRKEKEEELPQRYNPPKTENVEAEEETGLPF